MEQSEEGKNVPQHKVEQRNEERDVQEGTSGLSRMEIQELQAAAERAVKEAKELRADKEQLLNEVDSLKIKVSHDMFP